MAIMRNTAIGYPSGRCSSGMVSKFMPWMVPIRVGATEWPPTRRRSVDLLVLRRAGLGQRPHLLVLPLPDQRGGHRQRVLQQLPDASPFHHPCDVVGHVPQVTAQLDAATVLVEPAFQRGQHVRQRVGGPLELDDLPGW